MRISKEEHSKWGTARCQGPDVGTSSFEEYQGGQCDSGGCGVGMFRK